MWKILLLTAIFACNAKSRNPCKLKCERAYLNELRNDKAKGTVKGTSYLNKKRCYKNKCGLVLVHTDGFISEDEGEVAEDQLADIFFEEELAETEGMSEEETSIFYSITKAIKDNYNGYGGRRALREDSEEARLADIFFEEELEETEGMSEEEISGWFKNALGKINKALGKVMGGRRALRTDSEDFLKHVSAARLADIFFEEELEETEGMSEEEISGWFKNALGKINKALGKVMGGRRALRTDSDDFLKGASEYQLADIFFDEEELEETEGMHVSAEVEQGTWKGSHRRRKGLGNMWRI